MKKITTLTLFVSSNFGPLIIFYITNRIWGLKLAIVLSLLFITAEVVYSKICKRKITSFFKFSVAMALIFGILDLSLENAYFYKLEATITNLFTAFFFGITLFQPKPLIQQFAEQQGRTSQDQSIDKTFFFRFLTLLWLLYFVVKAALYLWINLNSEIEAGLIARLIIGNVSFWIMMFISTILARPIFKIMLKLKLMPSTRTNVKTLSPTEISSFSDQPKKP